MFGGFIVQGFSPEVLGFTGLGVECSRVAVFGAWR